MMTTTSTNKVRTDKTITALVRRGTGRGRTLGFPTANLDLQVAPDALRGLFAAWASSGSSWQPAVLYVGTRPTFGEKELQAEVHLLDHPGEELYGRLLHVLPVRFLTEERRFSHTGALALHLHHMCSRARAVLDDPPEEAATLAPGLAPTGADAALHGAFR